MSASYEPYRPQFHFSPAKGWINDPNGLIWWGGKYHLFYQHYPHAPEHGPMHWGHAVSDDLLRWRELPIALAPDPPAAPGDRSGIFSGSAVDDGGLLTLVYTQFTDTRARPGQAPETQAIATSRDGINFVKAPENPVIGERPPDATSGFRDPKVWRGEDGLWRLVLGSGDEQGGKVLLYRSRDLRKWEYLGVLYRGDRSLGTMWECPDFFPLGGKYVLLVSVNFSGCQGVVWFTGEFRNERFYPEKQGWCDFGPDFYAAQTFEDGKGRRILIAWMSRWGSKIPTASDGWAGAMTLPRELYLNERGELAFRPVQEVETLRTSERPALELQDACLAPSARTPAAPENASQRTLLELSPEVLGDLFEIEVDIELEGDGARPVPLAAGRGSGGGAGAVGFKLFRSPGGEDEVELGVEFGVASTGGEGTGGQNGPGGNAGAEKAACAHLYLDRERGSVGDGGRYALELYSSVVRLRIFVDRSSVEVFTSDGRVLTANVFPKRPDDRAVALFARGTGCRVRSLRMWRLASSMSRG